ncbi:MAG: NlpC/P60 family protein [Microcella sp.]|nr:NlpC/P60 family protein [Microcella sp.]
MRRSERRGIGVVALVTALILALGVGTAGAPDARAAPGAPTWDDVQQAKGDVEATEIAIARIVEAAAGLEQQYAASVREALERGEALQIARLELDEADLSLRALERRRDAALERAAVTTRQAAQIVAQLSRAGGGDVTAALLTSGDDADDLLYRLGTMSALGTRADAGMQLAELDRNAAAALVDQADRARGEREQLAQTAQSAADDAARAAEQAERRVAQQEAALDELSAQLASLTGRSDVLERAYLDSLTSGGGAPNPAPSNPPPGQPAPSPSPSSPNPAPSPSSPAPSAPPSAPAPSPSAPAPSPSAPPVVSGPRPNTAAVATAIAFARAQLGKPYQYGAAGPNAWDCSGLTMMAYSAAGYAIGGHGATAQYRRAVVRGLTVPYSQALPGDLIFYSNGGSTGGTMYHVTIYVGGGQMIEAPSPGKPVRIVSVRSYDRVPVVARPSG